MSGPSIHPTAVVHPDAQIDDSCEIGPYCTVDKEVTMGPRNRLISHVVVQNWTTIGADNTFFPFAVIGAIPQDQKFRGEKAQLVIGDRNSIRESATLNIGTAGGGGVTRIGDDNLLMAYVHIGHDSRVNDHVVIANSCQIAGHVAIESWATIGGLTGVSQFLRIGSYCYIGGCSGVERDVPPFTLGRGPTGAFTILGLNLVGLKRRGFSKEDICLLREIERLFFEDKTTQRDAALDRIEQELGSAGVVKQFVDFVRGSKKGSYR